MRRGGVCVHKACCFNSAQIEEHLLFGFQWVNPCLESQTRLWAAGEIRLLCPRTFLPDLTADTIFGYHTATFLFSKGYFTLAIRKRYGFSVQPSDSLSRRKKASVSPEECWNCKCQL